MKWTLNDTDLKRILDAHFIELSRRGFIKAQKNASTGELLSEQDVVRLSGLSRSYFAVRRTKNYIATGGDKGPKFIKVGRCVKYPRSDFEEWINERERAQ